MSGVSASENYYHGVIPHPEMDDWELKILNKLLPAELNSLVDLGCGPGEFLEKAKNQYKKILGIDLNVSAVSSCWEKKIPALHFDATKTPLNSHSFDLVRAQNILEHLQKPEDLIVEAKRILKKKGLLIIHVPTHFSTLYPVTNFWDDYTHVRPFTKRGVQRLLTDFGMEIVFIKGYTLGRNKFESFLGKILEIFFPFCWFVVAKNKIYLEK